MHGLTLQSIISMIAITQLKRKLVYSVSIHISIHINKQILWTKAIANPEDKQHILKDNTSVNMCMLCYKQCYIIFVALNNKQLCLQWWMNAIMSSCYHWCICKTCFLIVIYIHVWDMYAYCKIRYIYCNVLWRQIK